ncbi:MAG TPA: lipoyl synthase [Acidimicrobiales bacterium]|nr:lipoyl synthase [Acidimicrobiales bacterium]
MPTVPTASRRGPAPAAAALRVRWLGRVRYRDAHALQHALHAGATRHLLLMEHPPVFTLGVRADLAHLLAEPQSVGAELVRTDRGGDITYHGPGQLVGYPILDVPSGPGAVPAHVHGVEQVVIDTLADFGLVAGRLEGYPGVWVDPAGPEPRKIAAVGIRITRERSMHGFALNVDPDMAMFGHIVPCGIADRPVTSMAAEGVRAGMREVVAALTSHAARRWGPQVDLAEAAWTLPSVPARPTPGRPETPGAVAVTDRKPAWLRVKADMGPDYRRIRSVMRTHDLVTVCEEAGCPNIFECWADGTATFMINGERCTRACGFCLVDTRRPFAPDPDEPKRVAEAAAGMGLAHVVVTAVARDDLADGGAAGFIGTIEAIRRLRPGSSVEVLIPDCKGNPLALGAIFAARPDVLNHNLETVLRLQRAVRPSASYARSLAVLARAKEAGLTTKSGIILGLGEIAEEVEQALFDMRAVGVDIVTMGQYLRPSAAHLPVARWWTPAEIDTLGDAARALGFAHVEASPLTRSSYHARQGASAAGAASGAAAGGAGQPVPVPLLIRSAG